MIFPVNVIWQPFNLHVGDSRGTTVAYTAWSTARSELEFARLLGRPNVVQGVDIGIKIHHVVIDVMHCALFPSGGAQGNAASMRRSHGTRKGTLRNDGHSKSCKVVAASNRCKRI